MTQRVESDLRLGPGDERADSCLQAVEELVELGAEVVWT